MAATILYVHGQIDRLGDGYTSFCSINNTINCDRVLSSSYAKIAGVPVAWFAMGAYLTMAGLFGLAARGQSNASRARLVALGMAGVVGALVFSGYMALVAVVRLETLCLLCMGLYTVAIVNAALAAVVSRAVVQAGDPPPLQPALAAATFVGVVAAVSVLAWFTWPQTTASLDNDIRSADDVKRADPEFAAWFAALPKVAPSALLRDGDGDGALAKSGKVVIVDFFDLECAHCKKNYLLVKQLMARRGDQIRLVHRHFPLDASCNDIVPTSVHPDACGAAEAAECAGLQGKHDEMLDILFANQGQLFAENLTRLAGKIGLDKDAMQRCLDEHKTLPIVLADARAGARLDITSTPTVFIGGHRISGVLDEVRKYEMAVLLEEAQTR